MGEHQRPAYRKNLADGPPIQRRRHISAKR